MSLIEIFLKELEQEAVTTRKMLACIPEDKFSWQPHPKSMTIKQLATHIAELPGWVNMVLNTSELDFASNPYSPVDLNTKEELLAYLEKEQVGALAALKQAVDAQMDEEWTLRSGDEIYSKSPKHEMLRTCMNQIVHHRAQLGVDLRLLNVPIPGSYGPSADEKGL